MKNINIKQLDKVQVCYSKIQRKRISDLIVPSNNKRKCTIYGFKVKIYRNFKNTSRYFHE